MRRKKLLDKIRQAAAANNIPFDLLREGGNHSIYTCGGQHVVIPRHTEINELTARRIMKDLSDILGEDWWK